MGRPTKYKPEYCEKIIEFYSRKCYETIKGKRVGRKLPTLVEFARDIKVGTRTVYDWIDEKHNSYQEEFSHIYRNIVHDMQKNVLIQGGLLGYYNPMFCKFVATNLTDMKDKTELDGEIIHTDKKILIVYGNKNTDNTPQLPNRNPQLPSKIQGS